MNRLICVLGWEERFIKGVERTLRQQKIDVIDIIIYADYQEYTHSNYQLLVELCKEVSTEIIEHSIAYSNSVQAWKRTGSWINDSISAVDKVWLDISTMPRETIWTVLFFLRRPTNEFTYIYWPPETYDDEWLCKEPGRPRLLFKHSGITDLNKPTALVVLTGFDAERTHQLIDFFEPKLTIIGIQQGKQYDNESRNSMDKYYEQGKGETEITSFLINTYSDDLGLKTLHEQITPLLSTYNVLISSLGPKLSALSVYQLVCEFDEIALVYVPTKLYNTVYSKGIKDSYTGVLQLPCQE